MGTCNECYDSKNPFFEHLGASEDSDEALLVLDLDPEVLEEIEREKKSAKKAVR